MQIIVCIKQVPDVTEVSWDPETGSLIRKGIPSIMNPNDKNAIESALQLREEYGGEVTVLSMGPSQVEEALREALGMGVDKARRNHLPPSVDRPVRRHIDRPDITDDAVFNQHVRHRIAIHHGIDDTALPDQDLCHAILLRRAKRVNTHILMAY